MIGLVKLQHHLYIIHQDSCINFTFNNVVSFTQFNYNVAGNFSLWHHRLGHLFNSVIKLIEQSFPHINTHSDLICDCCHFAKQTKVSFSLSITKYAFAFTLIHMDIWGLLHPIYPWTFIFSENCI